MKACYLLFIPYTQAVKGNYTLSDFKKVKNAPYFFDIDIETSKLSEVDLVISDRKIKIDVYLYDQKIVVVECNYELSSSLSESTLRVKEEINSQLKHKALKDLGYLGDLLEEYFVLIFDKGLKQPNEFVKRNKYIISRLMRNIDKKLEVGEVDDILFSRVSYSKGDLTIVDWEGACVFAEDEDFESDIELMKVANYQLLRYRMLDRQIEENLKALRAKIDRNKKTFLPSQNSILKDTVDTQLSLLLDFDKVDQSLLLVGDWYSAKLYRLIVEEFYLDDWKNLVKERLNSLSSIDETVRSNLTFSWERFLDLVSVVGWAILLVGYFYLYFKDAGYL